MFGVCSELYKELSDLRGHRWATLDKESLCGKPTVLSEVKKIGYNASFFGNIVSSGDYSKGDNWDREQCIVYRVYPQYIKGRKR